MSGTPFRAPAALPELPKGAERVIIEKFRELEAAVNAVQVVQRNATPVRNVPAYMAKAGELVLLEGNAGGTLVTIPPGSSLNIEQTIRIALVGGLVTPGVTISIIGRRGTIDGAATFIMTQRMLVELTSIGERGWTMTCCGSGGLTPEQVFEQIYPIGSIYISTNSTDPATSLGFGTWAAFGAGRVPVGFLGGDPDFGTDEATGGAKTVAAAGSNSAPTFTGSALGTHTHTFTGSALANHAHELPFTKTAGGTGALRMVAQSVFGSGTSRASESVSANPTASATANAVALSQAVSAGTPAGTNASVSAGTPAGSVSAPTFTGTPTSVLQPYIVVRMWKRTA